MQSLRLESVLGHFLCAARSSLLDAAFGLREFALWLSNDVWKLCLVNLTAGNRFRVERLTSMGR